MSDPAVEAALRAIAHDPHQGVSLYDIAEIRVNAAREALKPIRELHAPEVINCLSCPVECEEHEGNCPDDLPVTVCRGCWEIAELANDYYGEEGIDQALLWPCTTAKLAYTTEELGHE